MKTTLLILALVSLFTGTHAAIKKPKTKKAIDTTMCVAHDTTVFYNNVEKDASFQGGELMNFRIFIANNVRYPIQAQINKYQGKVYVRFIVDWDGKVKKVTVYKSSGYKILDEEAIRVIKESPEWTPAKNNNICVPQMFVIPIVFNSLGVINK